MRLEDPFDCLVQLQAPGPERWDLQSSRVATTKPEVPPPMTMKSYSEAKCPAAIDAFSLFLLKGSGEMCWYQIVRMVKLIVG